MKDDLKDEEDLPLYEDFPLLPLPLEELEVRVWSNWLMETAQSLVGSVSLDASIWSLRYSV